MPIAPGHDTIASPARPVSAPVRFWGCRFLLIELGVAMKVTVERTALLKSLGRVHRVVERRNTIPILSIVRLDAAKGHLSLNATDMDIEIAETSKDKEKKTM